MLFVVISGNGLSNCSSTKFRLFFRILLVWSNFVKRKVWSSILLGLGVITPKSWLEMHLLAK